MCARVCVCIGKGSNSSSGSTQMMHMWYSVQLANKIILGHHTHHTPRRMSWEEAVFFFY